MCVSQHWAVTCGYLNVVEILLRAGASATSVSGKKPRREDALQMAERNLAKCKRDACDTRQAHDEAEKEQVRTELQAIRDLVAKAAQQRAAAKDAKKEKRATR